MAPYQVKMDVIESTSIPITQVVLLEKSENPELDEMFLKYQHSEKMSLEACRTNLMTIR